MDKQIVVSIRTVIFTFLLLLAFYIVYRLSPIIGILVVSTLIVISIEPMIKWFMKGTLLNNQVSRGLATILSYLILVVFLVTIIGVGLPPFVTQARTLLKNLSVIAKDFNLTDKVDLTIPDLLPPASKLSGGVLSITAAIFSNLTSIFSVLIISLYMSMDWENIKVRIMNFFPENLQENVKDTIEEVEHEVGHWVKGQLLLMFIIGIFSFIGLVVLDVQYALALGLIAGLLEIVPMIGPIISAILAGVVGFVDSPWKGLGVVVLFTVIQQLEGNIIVPQVMKKVSGFSPLSILLALLIGSEFFGILGAVIAIPVMMIVTIILRRFLWARV